MTETEFTEFVQSAVQRVTGNIGRIGNLVCTQSHSTRDEPTVREPEICCAFMQEAEARGIFYGIEVPTVYSYQFTHKEAAVEAEEGKGRSALVDFALLDPNEPLSRHDVLVEFKQGQPASKLLAEDGTRDYPTISKDLHKLWAEPGHHGRCIFHICQAADSGTVIAIRDKYDAVTQNAINSASATMRQNLLAEQDSPTPDGWFLLFILVLHQRGATKGSFLHRATWQRDHWEFE